ncbi:HAD hydrolase family protein [Propionibacteriaceae bacterium Y1923]|uniref:HAD hydrolase family protein n=1 Tax=Aestuariimicrobium sp. Y1814 TaxID=3418742 RepID=UPI003C22432F
MPIRLAMLDVDGTMMHRDQWNPGALDLIALLAERGIRVALCSGRPTGSLRTIAGQVPAISLVAGSSGATVMARESDEDGAGWQLLGHRALAAGVVERVLAGTDKAGIETWCYSATEWLVRSISDKIRDEETFLGDVPVLDPVVGRDDIGKVLLLLNHSEATAELAASINEWPGLSVVMSSDVFADVVPEIAARTKGGDLLMDHLGLGWDEVLAIGDGHNDIGMLSRAGHAVAVAPLDEASLGGSDTDHRRGSAASTLEALELVRGWL